MSDETTVSEPTQDNQGETLEQAQQAAQEALSRAAQEAGEYEDDDAEEGEEGSGVADESDEIISPDNIPEELVTGDEYIDAGLRLLAKSSNLTTKDISTALGQFFLSGDIDDLNGTYIKDKFGENADFAIKLAKEYASRLKTETTKLVEEVHALAGGEGAWEVAMTTFNSQAPDYLRAAAKSLADKGDPKSAAKVVLDYIQQTGRSPKKKGLVKGGSANLNAPLGKSEFAEAYADLKKRYPNQSLSSGQAGRELQRLIDRRNLAKKINR